MKIQGMTALVTGTNRGLGEALVAVLLERGAARVHATARDTAQLASLVAKHGERVVPHALDVTRPATLDAVAKGIEKLDLLINNAGLLASYSVLEATREQLDADLAVNFHGLIDTTRAFLPALERAGGAAVVNVLSVAALAGYPALGGYAASKTAAHSVTQSLRADLAKRGIAVFGVYPGPIDTDMVRAFEMPKTSPLDVARAIVDGIEANTEDIAPDPMSRDVVATWQRDPKGLERQFRG